MFKGIFLFFLYVLSIIIFIPASVVFLNNELEFFKNNRVEEVKEKKDVINNIEFSVNNNKSTNKNINITNSNFEDYIVGVLAAEMPVKFHEQALKAQAIAARTYAFKRVDNINKEIDHRTIGQAYNSINQMKIKWGDNFDKYYKKVRDAVYETEGIIMTYEDEPIEAVFHSTSAGTTEFSENIWGKNLPYIKSVDSKVDENAPNFIYTTKVSNNKIIYEISKKLDNIAKNKIIESFEISKRSDAGYVLFVSVCGKDITGRDIRTMFDLRSTHFTIKKNKDNIEFITKGYGHGAGMSQYGANFMAIDGKTYKEILNHYYKGINIEKFY